MTGNRDDALAALSRKIDAAKARHAPPPPKEDPHSAAELGWRMVIELVSGMLIGCGIGYGLDVLFGTLPWFLIPFTLLGFAAGVKTMMRSAQEFQRGQSVGEDLPDDDEEDDARG